jgi:hypothetical protein
MLRRQPSECAALLHEQANLFLLHPPLFAVFRQGHLIEFPKRGWWLPIGGFILSIGGSAHVRNIDANPSHSH